MIYTRKKIIEVIDDVIAGDEPVAEWDYFLHVKHGDAFADYWSARCRDIENRFSGTGGSMITEEGVAALRSVREELAKGKELP